MLTTLLLLGVVAGNVLHADALVNYRCNTELIQRIRASWNGKSNHDILKKTMALKDVSIPFTSPGFFAPQATCAKLTFKKIRLSKYSKAFLHMQLQGGKTADKVLEVREKDGVIVCRGYIDDGKTTKPEDPVRMWYMVYSKNNVMAYYFCLGGEMIDKAPEGKPEGVVIVKKNKYRQKEVDEAVESLKSVGIDPSTQYPYTCD